MSRFQQFARFFAAGLATVPLVAGGAAGTSAGNPGTAAAGPATASSITNHQYNIPPLVDGAAWMSSIPAIDKATLSALTLPGTHDAAANWFADIIAPTDDGQLVVNSTCDNTPGGPASANVASDAARAKGRDFGLTQHLGVAGQLRSGIRFFDLRVAYSVDGFYIHHGLLGQPVSQVLTDVRSFLQSAAGPKELVLLGVSHLYENKLSYKLRIGSSLLDWDENVFLFRRVCGESIYRDMSSARHEQLIALIEASLGPFLYRRTGTNGDLQNTRLGDIAQGGPKVVVIYPEGNYAYPDFLWNVPIDTNWANVDTLPQLRDAEQAFVDAHVAAGDPRLLELQWTLTARSGVVGDSTKCYILGDLLCGTTPRYNSVHDLSAIANPALGNFVYRPGQAQMNVIRVDFEEESPAVDIALDSPVAVCTDVEVAADRMCRRDASVDDGSSDNEGAITLAQTPPGPYALGSTPVKLWASDGRLHSSCSGVVTVKDKSGPVIRKLAGTPSTLWPPNHRMVPIAIQLDVDDNCDSKPACRIVQVASNEPEGQGKGAGNFEPDWVFQGDLGLQLRAERSGTRDGRRYDVIVECSDRFGNRTNGSFAVTVPH